MKYEGGQLITAVRVDYGFYTVFHDDLKFRDVNRQHFPTVHAVHPLIPE